MEVLYFFEGIRTDFLNELMQLLTHFGEETVFMVVAMFYLWCVNKRWGYYLLSIGFLGTQINQFLKATFRIPRPWEKDSGFSIVGDQPSGYSFPSGHTQSGVGTFGGVARLTKKLWLRILSIAICVIVPITRLYLGVHTPQDVITSTLIALVLVFGLYPLIKKALDRPARMKILLWIMLGLSVALTVYMAIIYDGVSEKLFSGLKNAVKMMGCIAGFIIVYELDERFIRYETCGCWWVQLIKLIGGLVLALLLKEGVYLAFGNPGDTVLGLVCRGIAYFLLVLFAGAVWPLAFKYIRKLDKKSC